MDKIIEKLDSIESNLKEKAEAMVAEKVAEVSTAVDAAKAEFAEKVSALEAKVAQIRAPEIVRPNKGIQVDVNRRVKEALSQFYKSNSRLEKEVKLFEDAGEYDAYMKEASALTGGGNNQGGRTAYDPVFAPLRLANPMRQISRQVATDGSSYQFRAKVGNAGAAWGYTIQNNGATTTENTNIWQLVLQDSNVQFPIRTAALDDVDGLEANVVSDMLLEFFQLS